MTEGELTLARDILKQIREEKEVILSNREKVDLDSVTDYFNNLLFDIAKNKRKGEAKGNITTYQLNIITGG